MTGRESVDVFEAKELKQIGDLQHALAHVLKRGLAAYSA